MRRGRSPREGQARTPQHVNNEIQSFAEWLHDHGWTYRAPRTWEWPATGKTVELPDIIYLGTPWVIAATATAIKIMHEPSKRPKRLIRLGIR